MICNLCVQLMPAADHWQASSAVHAASLACPSLLLHLLSAGFAGHSCLRQAAVDPKHGTHTGACCRGTGHQVALDIAMGLHCFHCNGIIHCDIK